MVSGLCVDPHTPTSNPSIPLGICVAQSHLPAEGPGVYRPLPDPSLNISPPARPSEVLRPGPSTPWPSVAWILANAPALTPSGNSEVCRPFARRVRPTPLPVISHVASETSLYPFFRLLPPSFATFRDQRRVASSPVARQGSTELPRERVFPCRTPEGC